jgi:hypothetical protein
MLLSNCLIKTALSRAGNQAIVGGGDKRQSRSPTGFAYRVAARNLALVVGVEKLTIWQDRLAARQKHLTLAPWPG